MNIAVHHTLDTHRGQSKSTHASSESLADQFVQVRDETRDAFAITISFGYIPRWNVCRLETQATTRTPKSTGSWVPLPSKSGRGHEGISNERERKQLGPLPAPDRFSKPSEMKLIDSRPSKHVRSLSPVLFPPFRYIPIHNQSGSIFPWRFDPFYNVKSSSLLFFKIKKKKKPFAADSPGASFHGVYTREGHTWAMGG